VTGRAVDAGSTAELAEALIDLLGDPARLSAMGRSARVHAVANHGWARSAERFRHAMNALGAGLPVAASPPSLSSLAPSPTGLGPHGRELDAPLELRPAA
jgi:hypothetical protein